jgi:rhodanese-related sulfurtransferase
MIAGGDIREYQLLDVRNSAEIAAEGKIAHCTAYRARPFAAFTGNLDPSRPTIVYCARGLRGYLAAMILLHHNFREVSNLGGGFKAWQKMGYMLKGVQYITPERNCLHIPDHHP